MTPMTRKIKYEDYSRFSGESDLNQEQALDLLRVMEWRKGAFLYFDLNGTNTFQLMNEDDDKFLAEITNDSDDMIFRQKYVSKQEAAELITHFYGTDDAGTVSGFYEVPTMRKTLDQVLRGE